LIAQSEGMYIPKTIKPMIDKIDTVLGLVAEKRLDDRTQLTVKRNLAFLLGTYGEQTKDVRALENSVRLSRDVLSVKRTDLESGRFLGDLETGGVLGRSLLNLGLMQTDLKTLRDAADIYRAMLRSVRRKEDPRNWAVLQMGLGEAQAELGKK
jgi:hypothetical protein